MGVLAMKTLADRGFFGTDRWDARPTGVSPLVPNRISVKEAIHFVWSLPVSTLITGAETQVDSLTELLDPDTNRQNRPLGGRLTCHDREHWIQQTSWNNETPLLASDRSCVIAELGRIENGLF
jgi:hypothetical protein